MSSYELANQTAVVKIFAGKAAPAYSMAKSIIHLIVKTSEIVNNDKTICNKLKIVFIPNYNVSMAELIIPATDVSEHISTVGKEASGTSNMKFSLNGALLLCTMDGSSIEIANEVGLTNVFTFGPSFDEQEQDTLTHNEPSVALRAVFNVLLEGIIISSEEAQFIINPLLHGDYFRVCADYDDYVRVQHEMETVWKDKDEWTRRSIETVAGMGRFSSDNAISKYCQYVWNVRPLEEQEREFKKARSFPRLNSLPNDFISS